MIFFTRYYWRSSTRKLYRFEICKPDAPLPEEGGIYIFVRSRLLFFRKPLYVGKAASLSGRLNGHERWEEARKRGANERHILCVKAEEERRCTEEDLIRHLKPRLNNMLVPRNSDDAPNSKCLRGSWMGATEYYGLNNKPAKKRSESPRTTASNYWGRGNKAA